MQPTPIYSLEFCIVCVNMCLLQPLNMSSTSVLVERLLSVECAHSKRHVFLSNGQRKDTEIRRSHAASSHCWKYWYKIEKLNFSSFSKTFLSFFEWQYGQHHILINNSTGLYRKKRMNLLKSLTICSDFWYLYMYIFLRQSRWQNLSTCHMKTNNCHFFYAVCVCVREKIRHATIYHITTVWHMDICAELSIAKRHSPTYIVSGRWDDPNKTKTSHMQNATSLNTRCDVQHHA